MDARLTSVLFVAAAAGCQPSAPSVPWLYGLTGTVSASGDDATAQVASEPEPGCGIGATRTIRLAADLAPAPGIETVVASYGGGITILGGEEQVLARSPGYPCEASADELETLAFGHAYGEPTLVIAATSGGRREAVTWLGLFRPGFGGTLDPVFAGIVEHRTDDLIERGDVWLVPDGLLYRRPGGPTTFWLFDPVGRAYVPFVSSERRDAPHVPPDRPST